MEKNYLLIINSEKLKKNYLFNLFNSEKLKKKLPFYSEKVHFLYFLVVQYFDAYRQKSLLPDNCAAQKIYQTMKTPSSDIVRHP